MSRRVGNSLYRVVKLEDEPGYIIRETYNRNRAETFAVGIGGKVYTTPEDAEKAMANLPERAFTRKLVRDDNRAR